MSDSRSNLLMLVLFFVSDDTVLFGTNINPVFIIIRYVIYVVLLIRLGFLQSVCRLQGNGRMREVAFIAIIVSSLIITMLVHFDFRNGYLLEIIVTSLAIQIARKFDLQTFFKQYVSVLFFFAVISLVVFPLSVLGRSVLDLFPVVTNYANVEFHNLFFCMVFADGNIIRNTSIFREPGIFAVYLVIGVAIELYFTQKVNYRHLVVFILALITTFSTTGLFILVILGVGYFVRPRDIKSMACLFFVIFAFLAIAIFDSEIYNSIFSKFDVASEDYASALARISSVSVPFWIFLSSPFFGTGLTMFGEQYPIFSQQLFGIAISSEGWSTNTLMNFFAIYGFLVGTLMLYGVFRFSCFFSRRKIARLVIFTSMLMIFSSQELRFSLSFCTFIMYGLFFRPVRCDEELR